MKNILKNTMMIVLALGVFSVATEALAGISYSDKKQGKVHFTPEAGNDEAQASDTATQAPSEMDPAAIEPSAGAEAPESAPQNGDVSDKIKLPRKH